MDKIGLYLRESYEELMNKVTWPSWANLVDSARVVLITTMILTVIIFVLDLVANQILNLVYGL